MNSTPRSIELVFLAACIARGEIGNKVCAACHAEIYKRYQQTGMARSSGPVMQIEAEGAFEHAASGVKYRVFREGQTAFFDFDLGGVHGRRRLDYFIGAGTLGRSYLSSIDGHLFQSPVAWYSARREWGLSPGYQRQDRLYLTRPVESACLQCHASSLQPTPGTQNGYAALAFQQDGVSCERCHGSGEEHVLRKGKIVNPAKLPADRRDSICAQCHLSGEARVPRGGNENSFRPGERLFNHVVVFVWSGGGAESKVTSSHFETLIQSSCKRGSADRLWCGTCHDPHGGPPPAQKVAYYRAKCLTCHETRECTRGGDCAGCHMQKNPVPDVEHTAYTDHAIRKPGAVVTNAGAPRELKLVPFDGAKVNDREIGLAYAGIAGFEAQAIAHLEQAAPRDARVMGQLALLYDRMGREADAIPLYEEVVKLDGSQANAAANLGSVRAKGGQIEEAIRLWQKALAANPGIEAARMNLAVAQFRTGDLKAAEASLRKLLELNPGAALARRLLDEMTAARR